MGMKAFSFFALLFVGLGIWLSVMTGGGGLNTTQINSAGGITDSTTTITVDSTNGFNTGGTICIDDEWIKYTGKNATQFTGCTRDADKAAHADNAVVRAEDNAVLNDVFGFDMGKMFDDWGFLAYPAIFVNVVTHTIPMMAQGNMGSLFQGGGLGIIVSLWLVFGAGWIVSVLAWFVSAIGRR